MPTLDYEAAWLVAGTFSEIAVTASLAGELLIDQHQPADARWWLQRARRAAKVAGQQLTPHTDNVRAHLAAILLRELHTRASTLMEARIGDPSCPQRPANVPRHERERGRRQRSAEQSDEIPGQLDIWAALDNQDRRKPAMTSSNTPLDPSDEIVDRGRRVFVFREGRGCLGHAECTDGGQWVADDGNHSRTLPTQAQAVNALRRGLHR